VSGFRDPLYDPPVRSIVERLAALLGLGAILAVVAFQLWITPSNPPGYHRDEAALSLNAYTLSTSLRDEDGARLPLFFRSFDDYKSPVYPYVLAGVFRVTGPSQTVARGLSAVLVLAAVLLLGVLARRLSGSWLVAAVVVVLAGRGRWRFLVAAWATFAAALVPLGIYALRHPGNLTARYQATTIAREGRSATDVALEALGNWFKDVDPWHWATAGDPAPYIHNGGYGALFGSVVLLALVGVVLVLRREQHNPFWRFVLLATLLVPVPAALTVDRYNAIRLATLPVLALVLAVPALAALVATVRTSWAARVAAGVLAIVVAAQFAQFLDSYRTRGPARVVLFDAGVKPLLAGPLASGEPIYLDFDDRGAQAQARWRAAAAGVPSSRIVILPDGGIPPLGSLVFLRFQDCDFPCREVARWEDYRLVRAAKS
jgi:hypothetical protein